MDKELEKIMKQLVRAQKSGNEVKIQDAANNFKAYLKPYEEKLFSTTEENDCVDIDEIDEVETIAFDYYEVIKFVIKRMRIKKFDEIRFVLNKSHYLDVSIVKKGEAHSLDFDAYVHHNDLQETEHLMEIEALSASFPDLDWNRVIDLLKNKDWSIYLS